jgi:hypothetical protein
MRRFTSFLFSAMLLTAPIFPQETAELQSKEDSGFSPPIEAVPNVTLPVAVQPMAQGDVQFENKRSSEADDMEALRRWIRDKRMVTLKELGGDLSISGDVRAEFQDNSEVRNGIRQRGDCSALERPQYVWDVEMNLMVDYRTDRTWAALKLEFDNDMGVRSGTVNKIKLEKAYLGGLLVPGDTFTLQGEIGRRYLFNVFESKIEFASLFDGVLVRINKAFEGISDFYANIGALLVDDKKNHYAYVAEIGGLRIANGGTNLKYAIIDWYKPAANKIADLRYKYLVSQLMGYYQCFPNWLGKKMLKIYGAGLCNHLAEGVEQTGWTKQRWGWFAGVSIGVLKKKYDWAIDANYQWAQAQVVPEFDCLGIGRGNGAGVGLYTNSISGDPASGITTRKTAVGSCNYKGFELEALYAFTDNLTVQQSFKYSTTLDKSIGPDLRFKQYEIEFIYAF